MRFTKVLALVACVILSASQAEAQTITRVSTATKNSTQTGASLVSATQTHTAGNLLVAAFYHQSSGDTSTGCTNTAGDTWAPTRNPAFNLSSQRVVELWYTATSTTAASTPTGTIGATNDVVTCTINSGNTFNAIDVYEFSKTSGTWGLVGDSTGSAASAATTFTTGTLTLTNPSVIVAELLVTSSQTPTPFTGYTQTNSGSSSFIWSSYHITSTSEAAGATGTSTGYAIVGAAFQASTGGGTPGCKNGLLLMGAGCDH